MGMETKALGLFALINSRLATFTDAEKKVAKQVLEEPNEAVYNSVTELAYSAGVSETTVLRFARKLGYQSYQYFKMDLAKCIASDQQAESNNGDPLERLARAHIAIIEDTDRLLVREDVEKAVDAMVNARTIHLYGVGHSGITARDGRYRLLRLGFQAEFFDDAHFQLMAASTLQPGDVAIGLSVSGSTKDTVESLRKRSTRATTIAVTSHYKSPITKPYRYHPTNSQSRGSLESGSFLSKIAQLYVLDVLFNGIAKRSPERVKSIREQMGKAISQKLF